MLHWRDLSALGRITRRPSALPNSRARAGRPSHERCDRAVTAILSSAASPLAVVYTQRPLKNKTVVFCEADSIRDDGPAGSAIRAIAADNKLVYETVEWDRLTQRNETRRIEKDGPTGLITTSTRSLATQMSTRTLEVQIEHGPEQTRAIMRAHARKMRPAVAATVSLAPFLMFQRWLEEFGEHRVEVPFGEALAELVSNRDVRMSRDFRQIGTAVEAVALLYQSQRHQNSDGWVIATLEDYEQARKLLAPIFEATAAEGLTQAIRQTVEAIGPSESVRQADLAERLHLSKATVSWRVKRAIAGGWLLDNEPRRGRPARLSRGAALPEATTALPTVEQVRALFDAQRSSNDGSNGLS